MFEDFLKKIEEEADKKGINADKIIEKYKRRYALALEAGFTEEEAIEKFGKAEDIVNAECGNENPTEKASEKPYDTQKFDGEASDNEISGNDFIIEIAHGFDLTIISERMRGISCETDGAFDEYYDITATEKSLKVKPKANSGNMKAGKRGELTVYVDKNLTFNNVLLSLAAGDTDASEFSVKTRNFEISSAGSGDIDFGEIEASGKAVIKTVSGDLNIGYLSSPSVKLSTVSGDADIEEMSADFLKISSVSGDVDIEKAKANSVDVSVVSGDVEISGDVGQYKTSCVSGGVTINGSEVSETVSDKVTKSLSKVFDKLYDVEKMSEKYGRAYDTDNMSEKYGKAYDAEKTAKKYDKEYSEKYAEYDEFDGDPDDDNVDDDEE